MLLDVIIIDDEEGSLFQLTESIQQVPILRLVECFYNVPDALRWLESHGPVDVIFSDIEMKDWNGLDAIRAFHRLSQYVIITTAYAQYWNEAIKKCVDGYLIKPVDYKAVAEQLETLIEKKLKKEGQDHYWDIVCFIRESKGQHHRIRIKDVLYLETKDVNYICVLMKDEREFRLRQTMKAVEQYLFPFNFVRIHQSFLVAFDEIEAFDTAFVTLSNGKKLAIGRSYKEQVLAKLQLKVL